MEGRKGGTTSSIHTHYADEVRLAVSTHPPSLPPSLARLAAAVAGLNGILDRCYFSGRFAPSLRTREGGRGP